MKTLVSKLQIDLRSEDEYVFSLPEPAYINSLEYEIEYRKEYENITLFLDIRDGEEKSIAIKFNDSGHLKFALNPPGIFRTDDFLVEKIKFNCYRELSFLFTLISR